MIVPGFDMIAFFYLEGDLTEKAEALFTIDSEWCVPFLWRTLFRSMLAHAISIHAIDLKHGKKLFISAESFLSGKEYGINDILSLQIQKEKNCSASDAEFIALAEEIDIPLITENVKVKKMFPDRVMSVAEYSGGISRK